MKKVKPVVKSAQSGNSKFKAPSSNNALMLTCSYICAGFAFLLYANTLTHEYAFDDFPTIYGNRITMMGFAGIPTLLRTAFWYGLDGQNDWLYRPLSMVMFAIEWGLSPNTPALSHWVNVLLHAVTAVVLFRFLVNLFQNKNLLLPFAITLLWLAHPIHTEVIANIKSRDEIMSFLFGVLTLNSFLSYIKTDERKHILWGCLFFFLSLMSKESGITLLAVVPLMFWFFTDAPLKKNLITSSIIIIPAVVYIIIRGMVLTSQLNLGVEIPLIDNSLMGANHNFNLEKGTAFYILGIYIKLLFFPHPMSSDYSFDEIKIVGFSNPLALISLIGYVALGVYALIRMPKKDPVAFGILFYLATISVVANVVFLTRSTMADRFLYMPSLGFSIILVILIARILKIDLDAKADFAGVSNLLNYNKSLTYTVGVILVLSSFKTIARNGDWKNDTTIFSTDVNHAPGSSRLHWLYANHMVQDVKQGKVTPDQADNNYNIAIDQFNKCIEIHPGYYEAYFGLSDIYATKKDFQKALYYSKLSVANNPKEAIAYNNLGSLYFKMQQFDSAIATLNTAIKMNGQYADAYNNLGSAYFSKSDFDNAIFNYKKAIEISPIYTDAWKNLGSSYGAKKDFDNSIAAFRKAVELDPNNAEVNYFLGITYQNKGDALNANAYISKAYELNPSLKK
ncbi:MAG: tetratricopeptide repeat protein [Bacteroidia bacterium]